MSTFKKLVHSAALLFAIAATPVFAPIAHAGGFSGAGLHAGMSIGSGFHSGSRGDSARGFVRTGDFRGRQHDWHQYGYWQNGAWIGIWPGYYDDAYNQAWDYYCDPNSPYFNPDVCSDQ